MLSEDYVKLVRSVFFKAGYFHVLILKWIWLKYVKYIKYKFQSIKGRLIQSIKKETGISEASSFDVLVFNKSHYNL